MQLTVRQQELLSFIREAQAHHGIIPSTREIQAHFGFSSQTAVMNHLRAIEAKGEIRRAPHKARGLILKNESLPPTIQIPVYGTIPAGLPADQQQESDGCVSVDLETLRLPKGAQVFALKVKGDSMINAGILSGDLVILEPREARSGDVVAALIDGETTLKRYLVQNGQPFLKAENPDYPDLIPALELIIQGVQIALLRVLKKQP